MRITESGLRRIIRQEVRALREGRPRQWAQGPAPSARTLRARLKALLGPASDRYELDAVYDFVWDIIQELRDPDPAGPQGASEILRMFEAELVRLLESNEQSGRTPGEIRETAKNIVAEFGPV